MAPRGFGEEEEQGSKKANECNSDEHQDQYNIAYSVLGRRGCFNVFNQEEAATLKRKTVLVNTRNKT